MSLVRVALKPDSPRIWKQAHCFSFHGCSEFSSLCVFRDILMRHWGRPGVTYSWSTYVRRRRFISCPGGEVISAWKGLQGVPASQARAHLKEQQLETAPNIWASDSPWKRQICLWDSEIWHQSCSPPPYKFLIWLLLNSWTSEKLHLDESIVADENTKMNNTVWFYG